MTETVTYRNVKFGKK